VARYLLLRSTRALATVAGVVTLVFLLIHLIPGDPVDAILGDQAAPEDRAALRSALRLDRPLVEQYLAFAGDLLDGSMGHSFRARGRPVAELVKTALPHTLVLAGAAMLLALGLALPLGALAAVRRGTGWDRAASTFAILGIAIPHIWLGPLLVLAFGVTLRLVPLPGDDPTEPLALVLPALTIGSALVAILTRQTRAALIEVLGEPYITAARARGVSRFGVLFQHALRNALLPVMTVAAAQLGGLLSGTVIAEKIFERPGLGTLFLEAFFARDIPVVQGCVLIVAIVYVGINFAVDLLYGLVDPRVRLA
jgi:peptide/nickel transport system permease protein